MSFHPPMAYGATFHKSSRMLADAGEPFEYTPERRARFDEIVTRYPPERRRSAVLPALYLVQDQQGYVTANAMRYVAGIRGITPADVEDVVSYYTMFHTKPIGTFVLSVCRTLSCALNGAERVTEELCRALGIKPGETDATVKCNDPILERVTNVIIGDGEVALEGAERAAAALGYHPDRWIEMRGEANDVGVAIAKSLCEVRRERVCAIASGEPVVTVRGGGRGGRAQQCALAAASELSETGPARRITALFAGTDGIDGNSPAAGAVVDGSTVTRASNLARQRGEAGDVLKQALTSFNAYPLFDALGDAVLTGPTGNNLRDLRILLAY